MRTSYSCEQRGQGSGGGGEGGSGGGGRGCKGVEGKRERGKLGIILGEIAVIPVFSFGKLLLLS